MLTCHPSTATGSFASTSGTTATSQLAHYRDYATPSEAIEGFVDIAGWYTLAPDDLSWSDVVYEVGPGIELTDHLRMIAGGATTTAMQESLKKSTILWLKWNTAGGEQTMPVWFLYDAKTGKIHVLSGERQQTIPGAELLREVTVVLRWKGKNSQVAEIPADVRVLEPGAGMGRDRREDRGEAAQHPGTTGGHREAVAGRVRDPGANAPHLALRGERPPALGPRLAPPPASFTLGQAAPDPVVDRRVHRVGQALLPNRARPADPLGLLVFDRPDREEKVGVRAAAEPIGSPILISYDVHPRPLNCLVSRLKPPERTLDL